MSRRAIMDALYAAVSGVAAKSDRNSALPSRVPAGGFLILREGEPGEPVTYLGRPRPLEHYAHEVQVELYVQRPAEGEAEIDALHQAMADAIAATASLGGLAERVTVGQPTIDPLLGEAGDEILAAAVTVTVEYTVPRAA